MDTVDEELRNEAKKRVQKRHDLAAHAVAYVVVNAMIIGIWVLTGSGYFWPAWVMLAWGMGLVLNAWDVLFRRPVLEEDIQREIARLQR
jgi:hypothetical protein